MEEELYLTLWVEQELIAGRWRPVLGPIRDAVWPLEALNLLFGDEYGVGAPVGGIEARGVPEDIGADTLRLGFVPIKKKTLLDESGEIECISEEDAQYEQDSWGAIRVGRHMFFSTADDFTYLSIEEFALQLQLLDNPDVLAEAEGFQEVMQAFRSLQSEGAQGRILLVLT